MVLTGDHFLQADVVFVIEGTANNGAYFNDIKTNYLIPALEYFTQGALDDRDFGSETTSSQYGVVLYRTADCLPGPTCDAYGPYPNAAWLLTTVETLELVGGRGESHANIAEGFASALQCLDDLGQIREPSAPLQRHIILICNSPPYLLPVMETHNYAGRNAEQLASHIQEKGINLSIISPRKIPALFKLFDKAGGDLASFQTKNYAKDPRHMVLLKGFSLKEHDLSPPTGPIGNPQNQHVPTSIPPSSMPSPLPSNDTPMAAVGGTQAVQNNLINQSAVFRPNQNQPGLPMPTQQQPHSIQMGNQMVPGRPVMATGGPQFPGQQIPGPPVYHPTPAAVAMGARAPPRWSMMPPQQRPTGPYPNVPQSSALIAQLTQPPNAMGGPTPVNQFGQRLDVSNNQQLNPALRLQMINNQPGAGVQSSIPQNISLCQVPNQQQNSGNAPGTPGPAVGPQAGSQAPNQSGQPIGTVRERHTIWKGVLEWIEKPKHPNDQEKVKRHVPCQVSGNSKDGQPELTANAWPQKLIMQLMPKQLIGNIGGTYLKNSKSVLFHPDNCEALDALTNVMSSGFAGCVHFTSQNPTNCDIKVLILLYTAEKRTFLGFIPNDQGAFVDRLRKVIQQQKCNQLLRQGQQLTTGKNQMPPGGPNQNMGGQQGNTLGLGGPAGSPSTSQTLGGVPNQTGMMGQAGANLGGPNTSGQQPQQAGLIGSQGNATGPRMSLPGMQPGTNTQIKTNAGGMRPGQQQPVAGMLGTTQQQRAQFDHMARQQNLDKIMQLKQTLEQAQQQEAQYQSQIEFMNHMKTQQIQEALQMAQQQEMQYKQQMEQEQQKQLRAQLQQIQQQRGQIAPQVSQAGGVGVAPGQRLMRPGPGPVLSNNPGLRHLLQQQPQYRQQLMGMQQMGGTGPRPQMNQQMNPNQNKPPNQFDDVSNFDFM